MVVALSPHTRPDVDVISRQDKRLVLTMDEVTAALSDRGITVAKPDVFK